MPKQTQEEKKQCSRNENQRPVENCVLFKFAFHKNAINDDAIRWLNILSSTQIIMLKKMINFFSMQMSVLYSVEWNEATI